jgi:hypothetical protein
MKQTILIFVAVLCASCYYVPKPTVSRPPAIPMPASSSGQACWNAVVRTHEICRSNCRLPYTQYNGREIEQKAQACVTACDDSRDANLKACAGN